MSTYRRYRIPTEPAAHRAPHPNRFCVEVNRLELAKLLLHELLHYRRRLSVIASRPCVYGVFSGPIGGFAPRPEHCVGCLRCTVEYPEVVQIRPNPERMQLGDSCFTPDLVDTVLYEASTGRVPVRGAGYRGPFGGEGWDALWTDMSEIVRPTRDGIHGREHISTEVDLGAKPRMLTFDDRGAPLGRGPTVVSLAVPLLLDRAPQVVESRGLYEVYRRAARTLDTLAVIPLSRAKGMQEVGPEVVPLVTSSEVDELLSLGWAPRVVELDGWDGAAYGALSQGLPRSLICVRLPMNQELRALAREGVRFFHLVADYHGRAGGRHAVDLLRERHHELVAAGLREQVTLVGSGGIVAAEHVPKAIICGLDAVALDTPLLIALQARFLGEVREPDSARVEVPELDQDWAVQRLLNLVASWRDQLLEILGAMGLREVRRLRGELGRAMFQAELEREALAGIAGFRS